MHFASTMSTNMQTTIVLNSWYNIIIILLFRFISLISLNFTWFHLRQLFNRILYCCSLVLCLDTLNTIAWFCLISLGMVTWQDIVLLLLGTLLRYAWYGLIPHLCLEALDVLDQFFIKWLIKPAPLSWTAWAAWDNLKQFQAISSSIKQCQVVQ